MNLFADIEGRARRRLGELEAFGRLPPGIDPSGLAARPPGRRAEFGDVVLDVSALRRPGRDGAGDEAPRVVATALAEVLARDPDIDTVATVAGTVRVGLAPRYLGACLGAALRQGDAFGRGRDGTPVTVTVERRADGGPGPDRVGLVAEAIASLLAFAGHPVTVAAGQVGGGQGGAGQGGAGRVGIVRPGEPCRASVVVKPCRVIDRAPSEGSAPPAGGGGIDAGADAAIRFALLSHRSDVAVTLDRDGVTDQSHRGPLFDVRYAKARACAVLRAAPGRSPADRPDADVPADVALLSDPGERALMAQVLRFPHVTALAAARGEPHRVALLLRDLAGALHHQWNRSKDQPQLRFVNEEQRDLTQARLGLMTACTLVLTSGLGILGIEAPDELR